MGQLYADNSGVALFEQQWMGNTKFFFRENPLYSYSYIFRTLGYLWIPIVLFNGLIKDQFVRRSLLVFIPFIAGMYIVGVLHELRIWGEMIPIAIAAYSLILQELFTRDAVEMRPS